MAKIDGHVVLQITVRKEINTEGVGGVELSSDAGCVRWLQNKGVQCVKNNKGSEVVDFESLVDGGTHKLGPHTQHTQQLSTLT